VADTGYHFTGWSDGCADAVRNEENVTSDINVEAFFAPRSDIPSDTKAKDWILHE
jgi:hypothetical protein